MGESDFDTIFPALQQVIKMSLWWYDPLYSCNPFYDPLPTINLDPMESLLLPFDLPRNLVRTPSRTKMSRSEVVSDKEKFQVNRRLTHSCHHQKYK